MSAKTATLFIAALLISGCAVPRADISPEGYLEIFGPSSTLSNSRFPGEWFVDGISESFFRTKHLNVARIDGSPALNLSVGSHSYIFAKRTQASLLATPYLSWSWNVPAFSGSELPLRLLIGFHGGNPKSASWGSQPLVYLGKITPPFDRALAIIWHQNALRRGTIDRSSKIPKYIARGGEKNTNSWQTENIDLAAIYKRIWPKDQHKRVKIMFAGFAVLKDTKLTSASFADVVLAK